MNQFSTLAFVTIFFSGEGGLECKLAVAQQLQGHALLKFGGFGSLAWGWGTPTGAPLELGGHSAHPSGLIELITQPCSTASSCRGHPAVLSPDVQGGGSASPVTSRAEQSVPSSASLPPPCPNFANNPLSDHFPFKPVISWSHLLHANPSP